MMDLDYTKMIEEFQKTAVLAFTARVDDEKLGATRFIKALFDNGCPADAVMKAFIDMIPTEEKEKSESEEK